MLLPASLLTFVLLGDFACALRLSFEGRRIPADRRGLIRRGSLSGSSPIDNSADLQYTTNITVGGVSFAVLIDTGSSDLWVAGSVPVATASGKQATISYASGGATGPIKSAPLTFAGYTVPTQAFMEVPPDDEHPVGQGLIGLGPSAGSIIFEAFDAADQGNTVLDSIFIQNTTTPNFITFSLGRLDDPSETFPGDLTVGEVMPNYTAVTNQPKLPVTDVSISNQANQHFQILLDANGFIGPNGSPIPISSEVSATSNKKQATVVIDTGFSLPQVPSSVAKAIYSQFSGAELVNDPAVGQVWFIPCTQEVNVTLKFGGNAYPVHPLDTTIDPTIFGLAARKNSAGVNSCIGLFQPFSFDSGSNPTYDMIFGMAFLRNVYTLINFGDFVADSTGKADPYIQFLSTTDSADAHADFVKTRLNGVDTTNNIFNSNNSNVDSTGKSKTIYYIIAACVVGVLLLAVVGAFLLRRSRSKQRGVYRPLHLPAPGAGNPPMYQQGPMYGANPPSYNPDRPYDPPQEHVPYHNPWEGRRQ
ncbi:aspartic peptidase domain-containing protein [Mycena rosella]|uniref:Aspartic peptidase domain-containing protein n=1 Tax=Mycena rosella TaxID=1033263 RepID=A0AAD7D1I2_MYCRO|nr:aspartic peptidase domain-containing protein [Mycena rosella]